MATILILAKFSLPVTAIRRSATSYTFLQNLATVSSEGGVRVLSSRTWVGSYESRH